MPRLDFLSSRQADLPLAFALNLGRRDPALQGALRKLHAGIVLAGRNEPVRTILLTSLGPREGKTFTTLALAQFVAATGRRVLVIECDLRRPAIAAALNVPASTGLVDVLKGASAVRNVIVRTDTPNLDAIPAGQLNADSAELLLGTPISQIIHSAGPYDLVLLDGPPASPPIDACMLAKQVDGVLCCTRWGSASLTGVAATVSDIRASGGSVFGMAITMAKSEDHALYESTPAPAFARLRAS